MTWLERLIERLLSVFPRLWAINPDEGGIRVTLGTRITVASPGWYIVWPLIQYTDKIGTRTQIKDLRSQSVWTRDRKEVVISGAVRYSVRDSQKAILECYDFDANIQALALGVIQQFVSKKDLDKLNTNEIEERVLKDLREASSGWGLKIERVYITDIGRTRNIRLLTNGVLHEGPHDVE